MEKGKDDEERPKKQPWAALDKTKGREGAWARAEWAQTLQHEGRMASNQWEMQIGPTAPGDGFGPVLLTRKRGTKRNVKLTRLRLGVRNIRLAFVQHYKWDDVEKGKREASR